MKPSVLFGVPLCCEHSPALLALAIEMLSKGRTLDSTAHPCARLCGDCSGLADIDRSGMDGSVHLPALPMDSRALEGLPCQSPLKMTLQTPSQGLGAGAHLYSRGNCRSPAFGL